MRRNLFWSLVLTLGLVVLVATGCGRREDPVASAVSGATGTVAKFTHDYGPTGPGYLPANGLGLTLTESPLRTSKTYRPPSYRVPGQGRPYPVLYLLLDFGGNGSTDDVTDEWYFEVGLQRIADSMINAGVIRPMIIATVDLHNAYGGSWYANSDVQGRYMDCLVDFVAYTDTAVNFSLQNGRSSRAISGVGMGGYGAIMMSMRRPDLFSSASSVNGHLAFATSSPKHGFSGVEEWAPRVFEENFVTALPHDQPATDQATRPFYEMAPDLIRPLRKPYTNLVFSMAAAFTPMHYVDDDNNPITPPLPMGTGLDSATWMNGAVAGGTERDWKVTLPFDWTGRIWPHAFALWQDADVSQFLSRNPVALADIEVLVMAGTTSEFNILQQNRIFNEVATSRGASTVQYHEFDGYGDYPTSRRRYLTETLREVLKFHSDNFEEDPFTLGP